MLGALRRGVLNLVVCSAVAEEGLDLTQCGPSRTCCMILISHCGHMHTGYVIQGSEDDNEKYRDKWTNKWTNGYNGIMDVMHTQVCISDVPCVCRDSPMLA